MLGCKLYCWLISPQVTSFQPNEVSFLVFGHISVSDPGLLHLDHQCLGLLSCFLELFHSEHHLRDRGWLIDPISMWVESV